MAGLRGLKIGKFGPARRSDVRRIRSGSFNSSENCLGV